MPGFGSRAHSIFRISIFPVVCVLAAVETSFAGACIEGGPQTTYQFVGQCTDCTGTGVGQLTVQNYTLGTALSSCNFVSFTYTSNLTSFTITAPGSFSLSGTLPASLPSAASIRVRGTGRNDFQSNTDGAWYVGLDDHGTGGIWSLPSAVPTLSTAAWCALGLLLAGAGALLAQRARRAARA
jgi:hypothetical protein